MGLPCVVRSLTGVRQLINVYLLEAATNECAPFEFSIAGGYVKLAGECGLQLSALSAALDRPVWYSYGRQTVTVAPGISNGVPFTQGTSTIAVGGVDCTLSPTLKRHVVPSSISDAWVTVETSNLRVWEGLLSEYDEDPGAPCVLSLQAFGGVSGVSVDGELLMLLPQTEMQGMLSLVCAVIAAIYLVGSASLYEQGRTVREVHKGMKETQLFLADGPLTALVATVSALMLGDPVQQMPWVIWQRAILCGAVSLLFALAIYLIYWCPDERATTLRTVVELPLLVAVYSPLASSASKVVDLAALLLGIGTILIAMRTAPRSTDLYGNVARVTAVCVQAPALIAGIITTQDDGFTQAFAAVALSLGLCAASMHVSASSPRSTPTLSE